VARSVEQTWKSFKIHVACNYSSIFAEDLRARGEHIVTMNVTADYVVNYAPLNSNILESAGIVLISILVLFVSLFLMKVVYAALVGLVSIVLVSTLLYKMPVAMCFSGILDGILFGIWPVVLIILAAVFLFDLNVVTGYFEAVKFSLVNISEDKRILALLLAYCFSGFVEGFSGFSTPVALVSAVMMSIGFEAKETAVSVLLGNTIPVFAGGIGIPVVTLASVTGMSVQSLVVAITRLILPFSFIMPALVVFAVCDPEKGIIAAWYRAYEVFPAILLVGVVQSGLALFIAQFIGPSVISLLSFLITLGVLVLFLKYVWKPKKLLLNSGMLKAEVGLMKEELLVYKFKRLSLHDDHSTLRFLDSSQVSTALFPHSLEYKHGIKPIKPMKRSQSLPNIIMFSNPVNSNEVVHPKSVSLDSKTTVGSTAPNETEVVEESNPSTSEANAQVASSHEVSDDHASSAMGLQALHKVSYDLKHPPTRRTVILAWIPWILVCVIVPIWASASVQGVASTSIVPNLSTCSGLNCATFNIPMPGLNLNVYKPPPYGHGLSSFTWTLNLLGASGIALFICSILSGMIVGTSVSIFFQTLKNSFSRMSLSFLTICLLMAFGFTLKTSGQDVTLGIAAAMSEKGFPFISPIIGFLGVALTGSATSTSVIFGSMQVTAAAQLGLNPVQMAASNMVGGQLGHIVATSSMVVAGVSTGFGEGGKKISGILRAVGLYAILLLIFLGFWNMLIAFCFPSFLY
jgi:L-lactate permease